MEQLEKLIAILRDAQRIVFFGGAGVSTESGLKDYRSPDGIYRTATQYGKPPEDILSHDCLEYDPELFYRFFRDYFLGSASPNRAHYALAKLEQLGKHVAIVTQNIDGLHQEAGSSLVYELHGTIRQFDCTQCGESFSKEYVKNTPANIPRCPKCGGFIRPHVTMYGESLEDSVVQGALREITRADTMLIGGTSLAVYPAASFVQYFRGKHLIMLNREPTGRDRDCELVFREPIGKVLGEAVEKL